MERSRPREFLGAYLRYSSVSFYSLDNGGDFSESPYAYNARKVSFLQPVDAQALSVLLRVRFYSAVLIHGSPRDRTA